MKEFPQKINWPSHSNNLACEGVTHRGEQEDEEFNL